MPLVAYSDDDSSDEDTDLSSTNTERTKQDDEPIPAFKALPTPKARVTPSLNDLVLGKTLKGNVKITVPEISDFEEERDEEEEQRKKRIKLGKSTTGSCLLSILPSAGKSKVDKSKQLSLVPQSVSKPKTSTESSKLLKKVVKNVPTYVDDEDGDDEQVNFFSFSESSKPESEIVTSNTLNDVDISLNVDIAPTLPTVAEKPTASSSYAYPSVDSQPVSRNEVDINDPAYKRLIAQKFGEEPPEAINIIDINASKYIGPNREYLKTITMEKPEEFKGIEPSSTAKRKHQITYLAFQAKQRELQLKNEWATNKVTKKQTRAKYGF